MAGHAAFGKQFCRRLAPIEVLRQGYRAAERSRNRQNEKTAAHSVEQHRLFPCGRAISGGRKVRKRWQVRRNLLAGHGEKWERFRHYYVAIAATNRSRQ